MKHAAFFFYNLDNGRNPAVVGREIRAILASNQTKLAKRPALLAMCEATGYALPGVTGYHLVRDRSTKSRGNIAAYVRQDLFGGQVTWTDHTFSWPRTKHSGTHEPRSTVKFRVGQMPVIVYHAPPKNAKNATKGQQEGIDLVEKMMRRDRTPCLVVADWNRRKKEKGPGPSMLAARVGGKVKGSRIDAVVKRGAGRVRFLRYQRKVRGVVLRSDHQTCLRFRLVAPANYWRV